MCVQTIIYKFKTKTGAFKQKSNYIYNEMVYSLVRR